ncbi:hypothetical protein ACFWEV_34870 [Streptomyces bacillaris]|uniref:galactose-binding domain-containing protein n=1 Tax=Streptomyces bacillaris TaxID=68179 RepID=UPI003655CBAD
MPQRRIPRAVPPLLVLGAVVLALLAVSDPADGGGDTATVTPGAEPAALDLVPLPCAAATFQVTMANSGAEAHFADLTLTADEPLSLSRDLFSSYLPAAGDGQPVGAPVEVTAPRDTPPGSYQVVVEQSGQRLSVPVRVRQVPASGPGDDLALREAAFASSTHFDFSVCGGVDGDTDQARWETHTGWHDATPRIFPDTYGVRLPGERRIAEVTTHTVDSAAHPADRFGLRDWDVQVLADGGWRTVGEVRGNTAGRVTTRFAPVTAEAVRLLVHGSNDATSSRVLELEVGGG